MENPLRPSVSDLSVPDGLEIIETLGWHPDEGMRHAALHIARMDRTAAALGFRFDPAIAATLLAGVASLMPLRCRMTLTKGGLTLTTATQPPNPPVWRVGVASERLSSADPWLRHKTSNRAIYTNARANLPAGLDELIFLNERDEVCEGTITSLFATLPDGTRVTPPLASGLLPGILRQTLLAHGYVEQVLTLADLKQAQLVQLGNSARGLIRAEIAGFA